MVKNLFRSYFSSSNEDSDSEKSNGVYSFSPLRDTRLDMEYREFLPQVSDTWTYLQSLSAETTRFRDVYDLYRYERSESQQKIYFEQLKTLDESIYKLSATIHQRIQTLEKLVQPILDEYHRTTIAEHRISSYVPASIRIAQNQLNSLKSSFKRIILKHNGNALNYQNDLRQSVESSKRLWGSSRSTLEKIQTLFSATDVPEGVSAQSSQAQIQLQIMDEQQQEPLTERELEILDLEGRLESLRVLKDRVRQMNEMTMALYISVQEQNEITDNIWLNTSAGSDYIDQSVEEFRLVKNLKSSEMNFWMKMACVGICFLLLLLLILSLLLLLNQR